MQPSLLRPQGQSLTVPVSGDGDHASGTIRSGSILLPVNQISPVVDPLLIPMPSESAYLNAQDALTFRPDCSPIPSSAIISQPESTNVRTYYPFRSIVFTNRRVQMSLFSPHNPVGPIMTETPYQLNTIHTPSSSIASINSSPLPTNADSSSDLVFSDNIERVPADMEISAGESTAGNTNREDRRRATATKPVYGHVSGVLRGSDKVHGT